MASVNLSLRRSKIGLSTTVINKKHMKQILLGSLFGLLFFIVPLLLLCFFGDTEINTELRKSNKINKIELPKWDDPNTKEALEATLFPKIQSS
jgi:hypothetical protein